MQFTSAAVAITLLQVFALGVFAEPLEVDTRSTIPCGAGTCDGDSQVCCGDDKCYIKQYGCITGSKRGTGVVPPQPIVQRSTIKCGSGTCDGDDQVCCGDNKCYIKKYGCGKRSVLAGAEPVAM